MNIQMHCEGIVLSAPEKAYIKKKLLMLRKYSVKISDEAVLVKVTIEKKAKPGKKHGVQMSVTLIAPMSQLRAEIHAITIEEGIDAIHDKLERQIEKYKAKYFDTQGKRPDGLSEFATDSQVVSSEDVFEKVS